MKLNCISTTYANSVTLDTTIDLLRQSCDELGCEFSLILSDEFDFSKTCTLNESDMLYCLTEDYRARLVENMLINNIVKSFYKDMRYCYSKIEDADDVTSMFVHLDNGLPTINTVPAITSDKVLMKHYVDKLGGFPIILKAVGNTSHGLGTMRLDSFPSLFSVTDYLAAQGGNYILKSYISVKQHIRVIVLGEEVIDSIEYEMPEDDFRSNASQNPQVKPIEINREIQDIAVRAVNTLGYLFGGVDILIDEHNLPHIAEVNFPCYFGRAQQTTGTPIATKMIEFLKNQSP